MTAIPKPTGREEWLDLRRPYVGASEAAALINRHPFLTLQDLTLEHLDPTHHKRETHAMRRGRALEEGVALLWSEEHGIAVEPCAFLFQRGGLIATPDYVPVGSGDSPPWLLECKTTGEYLRDEPLDYWMIQCIVQAHCAGVDRVEIAAIDASMSLRSFTVDTTTDLARALMDTIDEAADQFLSYVSLGMIPEGLELNERVVKALWPRAERKAVELDQETVAWVTELAEARDLRIAAERREQDAKDALAAALVDADIAQFDGHEVLSWRNNKSTLRVDWKALEEANPTLVDEYRIVVPGPRVMRVTKARRVTGEAVPWVDGEEP